MEVRTKYGVCKNVDLEHMLPYGIIDDETDCFMFKDYISENDDGSYRMLYFEVWKSKNGDSFHFYVEENKGDGSSISYGAGLSEEDKNYIVQMYYDKLKEETKLSVIELGGRNMAKREYASKEEKENAIEVIFDKYEEVKLNQNGFTVTFENKADVLEAFKALTRALDKMDKDRSNREMGFDEETK